MSDKKISIAFICTANVCRSVMAHAICEAEVSKLSQSIQVHSAGILDSEGRPPADSAWVTCLQHRTPVTKMQATFVRELDLPSIDHFLVMERRHLDALISHYKVNPSRISLLSSYDPQARGEEIEDPMNESIVEFERCYARMRDCITCYLDSLTG